MAAQHGTPLDFLELEGRLARFHGIIIPNLPRGLDAELMDKFSANGEAVRIILKESFTREKLDRALVTLGKKETEQKTVPLPPTILFVLGDDGRTAEEIIKSIEAKGGRVSDLEKQLVAKANEPIPPVGRVYPLVGIRGEEFATDAERTTRNIYAAAASKERQYPLLPVRAALLLRDKFITQEKLQEKLGCRYVSVMHKPVRDAEGCPRVSGLCRSGAENSVRAWDASVDSRWHRERLFVFLFPISLFPQASYRPGT